MALSVQDVRILIDRSVRNDGGYAESAERLAKALKAIREFPDGERRRELQNLWDSTVNHLTERFRKSCSDLDGL